MESLGGGVYGSVGASGAEGGERREGGKRGRRPGRKAQLDKQDMKAKLVLQVEFGARPGQDAGGSGSRTPRDGDRETGGE
ncbi:hypothetical protein HF086_002275 [Spodoptera exigua]|uniref:Uncharacterized protein n=1 Tax=Spodoptera exigua TaxID=7107 RepID=A0A922MWH6_SPOEX|nr:hypothetical protein HF086_002275 [Spodoptera exigua]